MTQDATDRSVPDEMVQVLGFPLALDRMYQPGTHMWVRRIGGGGGGAAGGGGGGAAGGATVLIGMDPLGIETNGTLAQLSFEAMGATLTAGRPFGQLEAAKFVGPLLSPVSGTLLEVNDAVAADPGLAERDPYRDGWLISVTLDGQDAELPGLLSDREEIIAWFTGKVEEYRLKGVLAE